MISCTGCDRPILDRYLFNLSDQSWHPDCVTCSECKVKLTDKCFSRDGKLFCRIDFFKKFGTKCAGCLQGILPTDLVRRARSKVFHLKCFTCMICRKQLSTGEELYILDEHRFICKEDFLSSRHNQGLTNPTSPGEPDLDEASMVSPPESECNMKFDDDDRDDDLLSGSSSSHLGLTALNAGGPNSHHPYGSSMMGLSSKSSPLSASSSLSDSGLVGNGDSMCAASPPALGSSSGSQNGAGQGTGPGNDENTPGTKRRGPRTTIKAKQLETLKAAFAATPKPTRHIREQLATETGLNMRVIQVWFQNRRSKERRMKQLSSMGARRHFFRSPRRAMRPLRPGLGAHDGLDDSPEMVGGPSNTFGYFSESSNPGDFGYGGPGGQPHHPQHPAHPGPPGPPYYDFFGPGSGGPYPGDPHPMPDGPNGPNPGTPISDPSMAGIEAAGGWGPMSQL